MTQKDFNRRMNIIAAAAAIGLLVYGGFVVPAMKHGLPNISHEINVILS